MKAANHVLFSKASDLWGTPPDLFARYDAEFRFTLDGAADATSHLCDRWLGPGGEQPDALLTECHDEVIWLNPPYSACAAFLQWAATQAIDHGSTVVVLIPARTDTRYWHDWVWDRDVSGPRSWVRRIDFLKGRVKFVSDQPLRKGTNNSAPFPSVVVVMGPVA